MLQRTKAFRINQAERALGIGIKRGPVQSAEVASQVCMESARQSRRMVEAILADAGGTEPAPGSRLANRLAEYRWHADADSRLATFILH